MLVTAMATDSSRVEVLWSQSGEHRVETTTGGHSHNLETRGLERNGWLVDDEEEDSQVQVEMLRVKAIS